MIDRSKLSADPATAGADHRSWGLYPHIGAQDVTVVAGRDDTEGLFAGHGPLLPYGLGRSYGDSCLNEGGTLLDTSSLRRFISFDELTGTLRCEAGVTLGDILELGIPRGWFLPTSPGTKFVTVGGAIANDVHGKNHHVAGTFGRHVTQLELLRSNGERLVCSPSKNRELFQATIGGLGLTGLILWAEIRLRKVDGPFIDMESIRFSNLSEFFEIEAESEEHYEFTMSFVDAATTGKAAGRGLFMRGNHAWQKHIPGKSGVSRQRLNFPVMAPGFLLNKLSVTLVNNLLYYKQPAKRVSATVPFDPFFYPLDSIGNWNRMYGTRGFIQHQCVVPPEHGADAMYELFDLIASSGEAAMLAVLKKFGELESPGILSFPRPGLTLALDFPMKGARTLDLCDRMDEVVLKYGGAIYPAKDARMAPATFKASFPRWQEFSKYVDPRFSSSFWRRVTAGEPAASSGEMTPT
ncbi:MAG: FAD-dependent oxidoreductase [Dehalococcoidia bacterium]